MRVTFKYKSGVKKRFEKVEYVEEVPNCGKPAITILHDHVLTMIDKKDIDKIKIKLGD